MLKLWWWWSVAEKENKIKSVLQFIKPTTTTHYWQQPASNRHKVNTHRQTQAKQTLTAKTANCQLRKRVTTTERRSRNCCSRRRRRRGVSVQTNSQKREGELDSEGKRPHSARERKNFACSSLLAVALTSIWRPAWGNGNIGSIGSQLNSASNFELWRWRRRQTGDYGADYRTEKEGEGARSKKMKMKQQKRTDQWPVPSVFSSSPKLNRVRGINDFSRGEREFERLLLLLLNGRQKIRFSVTFAG